MIRIGVIGNSNDRGGRDSHDTRRRFRIRPILIFYAWGGAAYPSITPATSLAGLLDMRQVVHRDATDGTLSPVEFRLNRALLFDAVSEHREHGANLRRMTNDRRRNGEIDSGDTHHGQFRIKLSALLNQAKSLAQFHQVLQFCGCRDEVGRM